MHRPRTDDQVAVEIDVAVRLLGQQEPQRIPAALQVLFEPSTQRGFHVVRVLRQDDQHELIAPLLRPILFGQFAPRVALPFFSQHHDTKLA